jgi:protein-S-isoprenylcysteine O-methyltransferase Ste14
MRSIVVSCLLLAGFFVVEAVFRQGERAKTMEAGPEDRGTSRLIAVGFLSTLLSGLLGPLLSCVGWGTAGPRVVRVGQAMMVAGLGVKVWAMLTLGRFYTRTLRTDADDQVVVQSGPYRLIRHPGYLGTLLVWAGFGWATHNWLAGLANTLVLALVYGRRITVEEAMLRARFGETYAAYARRTWRLVPGLV